MTTSHTPAVSAARPTRSPASATAPCNCSRRSPDDAAAVLRRAVELGVNHIDTASFYGPGEVNRRIRAALAPYPDDLVIVSKVGARYTGEDPIPLAAAQKPAELRAAVEDDLRQLGLDQIPVVNLRRLDLGPGVQAEGDQIVDLDDQLAEMIALRDEGKIGAIGISSGAARRAAARAARGHRLRAERLQRARPLAGRDARRVCAERGHRVGAVSSRWARRSRLSRRSPTTRWCKRSPANSASHRPKSGWLGCWPTLRTRC